jgi:hypothetical protein
MRIALACLLVACASAARPGASDLGPKLPAGACAQQDDCPDGSICLPIAALAANGSCSAPSTHHCGACAVDADCGTAGRCLQGPGDDAPACHVDCSLSYLVCPKDYNCASVLDGTTMRQLCLPVSNHCAEASGGSCTEGTTQPCTRMNSAGSCSGTRSCMGGQLGPCAAPEPAFLSSCSASAPPGCTELPSAAALATATDCGVCGNACPGVAATTADAACLDPTARTCGITCRGDNYDVDGNAANGCEVPDPQPSNHEQATATSFPQTDCNDSTSANSFSSQLLSDTRVHRNPSVTGFLSDVGAAPHWYSVFDSGGFCENDYALTFTTSGGANVACYVATIITDKIINSVTTTGAGTGMISGGIGSYSNNSTIYFKVEKICSSIAVGDANVAYTVSYHL